MREILFRGKTKSGEWAIGNYLKTEPFTHARGIHSDWIIESAIQNGGFIAIRGRKAVLPETVGQYTGLTDKNGTKIFEGDILEFDADKKKSTVIWGNGEYNQVNGFRLERFPLFSVHEGNKEFFEVIGNIYDNPELLEDIN